MATKLAFQASARTADERDSGRAQCTAPAAKAERWSPPPVGAGDPAVEIPGPLPFTAYAHPRSGRSRFGWVDGLVTLVVMAWFTAALALMAGEWLFATWGPVAQVVAGPAMAAPVSQAAAIPPRTAASASPAG